MTKPPHTIPKMVPCKIGTIPFGLVQIHGVDAVRMEVGKRCRIKERPGARWTTVLITRLDFDETGKLSRPLVYFMADQ